ncbi:ribosomal RNA-processing protein 8 isoform X2 [Anolis sagrei]|uniref:ribosomal RNA-processing protein 8 isoform X2 n=1 Tax=Anolis sagrei TaxID=38937 RepID=UPI003522AF31
MSSMAGLQGREEGRQAGRKAPPQLSLLRGCGCAWVSHPGRRPLPPGRTRDCKGGAHTSITTTTRPHRGREPPGGALSLSVSLSIAGTDFLPTTTRQHGGREGGSQPPGALSPSPSLSPELTSFLLPQGSREGGSLQGALSLSLCLPLYRRNFLPSYYHKAARREGGGLQGALSPSPSLSPELPSFLTSFLPVRSVPLPGFPPSCLAPPPPGGRCSRRASGTRAGPRWGRRRPGGQPRGRARPASLVVADFGCGDCTLARSVRNQVHCFDLEALDPRVIVCDMSQVPLEDESVDVAVFCLALMGTNVQEILAEASRVLRMGGTLLVAEVASRFSDVRAFVGAVSALGFSLRAKDVSGSHFFSFEFSKAKPLPAKAKALPGLALRPCLYKRR